jgi:hypothetical protein
MIDRLWASGVHSRCVPGMESGTFRSRASGDPADTYTDYPLAKLKLKKLKKEDIQTLIGYPSNLAYLALRSRVCQVWQEHLTAAGAPDPKVDDLFVVGGITWVVKSVDHKMLNEVHNCLVERE